MPARNHQSVSILASLYVCLIDPLKPWNGIPRLQIDGLSQLRKGGTIEDALPAEEGGAVTLVCE
jgi:hypothetical protein